MATRLAAVRKRDIICILYSREKNISLISYEFIHVWKGRVQIYIYIYTLVQQCLAQIYNGIGQSVAQRGYRVGGEKRELSTHQRVNWIDCNIVKN